ncbi:MAG TPA: hypothetical protein DEG17_25625 [Cyanobacteria bacterium UBA11149]|nr:hypothetical protein [Cyanobacteria bacterium UBA11367]HBE57303.1 hypothetical protein [Cyanobacteria bacterium UBA11366]HBR77240.1 hypothetical protein [Cyanobacteria bacterium UBA11159]HBS67662.1 hypothetical protein [Cyanobacteria bacterium UBA11153]HBW92155.1 hypothetical protein [Cyanobacteria bacterium UBA11149]HCA96145.1 hypothetical protein [Cyanobacteria bacterium UBA9226]
MTLLFLVIVLFDTHNFLASKLKFAHTQVKSPDLARCLTFGSQWDTTKGAMGQTQVEKGDITGVGSRFFVLCLVDSALG